MINPYMKPRIYFSEKQRLKSFKNYQCADKDFVFDDNVKRQYALAGLYWTKQQERIKCAFCHFHLIALRAGDTDPIGLHYRFNSTCSLYRFNEVRNKPINEDLVKKSFLRISQYELFANRIKSFNGLIISSRIDKDKAEKLCNDGYFSNGTNKITCYYCGAEADIEKEQRQIYMDHIRQNKYCPSIRMLSEVERLKSFENYQCADKDFVFDDNVKRQYALAGLYWIKQQDQIKCAFCHLHLNALRAGDTDPIGLHYRLNPTCPLYSFNEVRNKPINEDLVKKSFLRKPRFSQYELFANRIKTFNRLIISRRIDKDKAENLCHEGYFSNGTYKATCYYCGAEADIDKEQRQIYMDHIRQNQYCPSIRMFSELERLKSFENYQCADKDFVFDDNVKREYALAGLYWTKQQERIKCAFCHFHLIALRAGDTDPIGLHYRFNSTCSLYRFKEDRNKPINEDLVKKSFLRKPRFSQYELFANRIKTFNDLIISSRIDKDKAENLCHEGYFSNGTYEATCYYCGAEADIEKEQRQIYMDHIRQNKYCQSIRMFSEVERLKSFENYQCADKDFVFDDNVKREYALAGLYWIKQQDQIKCVFCHLHLNALSAGDTDPIGLHYRLNPTCPLYSFYEVRNKPINEDLVKKSFLRKPRFSQYELFANRIKTFNDLIISSRIDKDKAENLCHEGYFSNGTYEATCYYCGAEAAINEGLREIYMDHIRQNQYCPSISLPAWITGMLSVNGENIILGKTKPRSITSVEEPSVEEPIIVYEGSCETIINKMLVREPDSVVRSIEAIFVPASPELEHLASREKYLWDCDLTIAGTIKPMKLIWVRRLENLRPPDKDYIRKAFSFHQPTFLKYLDKPFTNHDAITQVNLLLDYHRTQKRKRGIEVFTLFDLVAFKMAIDDNRVEYYNCEFHKIIERTLREAIQSAKYVTGANFNLNAYLCRRMEYRSNVIFVDYLIYHFHEIFGSIYWHANDIHPMELSDIANIPYFLKTVTNVAGTKSHVINVGEIDPSGIYSTVLYEILSKATSKLTLQFILDDEWIYSAHDSLNETTTLNRSHKIIIRTKNLFNFIENSINWLRLMFGEHTEYFDLEIECDNFPTIKSYIFNGLHVNTLAIDGVTLDYKLCRALNMCRYKSIRFQNCKIQNDNNVRFEFLTPGSVNGENIFKFLNLLQNVYLSDNITQYPRIELILEEHTIGILFAYVASVMMEENLDHFFLLNAIEFQNTNIIVWYFQRFKALTCEVIEICDNFETKIDLYRKLNKIKLSARNDFDFYK